MAGAGHYRRLGVVSMPPPDPDPDQPPHTGRVKAEVARRISLDDLSAAFQGEAAPVLSVVSSASKSCI